MLTQVTFWNLHGERPANVVAKDDSCDECAPPVLLFKRDLIVVCHHACKDLRPGFLFTSGASGADVTVRQSVGAGSHTLAVRSTSSCPGNQRRATTPNGC